MTFRIIPGQPIGEMDFDGLKLRGYVPGPKGHLARLLLWAMKKLGATELIYKPHVRVEWVDIDAERVIDYINEARSKFYHEVHVEITCILMGPEEFYAVARTPDTEGKFQWTDWGMHYRGLTIILVPWMKGVLPLKEIPQIIDLERTMRP